MFVSATRLRIRSSFLLLPFLWYAQRSTRQASKAAGFVGGRVLNGGKRAFWTLTAWESEQAMRQYRSSGAHGQAMPHLLHWCDEASVVHWNQDGTDLPQWSEAVERMRKEGRSSRVANPSPDHAEMRFPDPRVRRLLGQDISPKH